MIIEDVVDFFRQAPPLSLLEPARLAALARKASLDYFPAGTLVLGPGGQAEGMAAVVRKGALEAGGEFFGELSVLGWAEPEARAVQDSVCLLLPPEILAEAVRGRPELADFLEGRLSPSVLELGLQGLVREIPAWLSRRPLASVTAGEAARPGESLPCGSSIGDAARAMTEAGLDAAVVLGPEGRPAGLVTDRDFRARAVAQGLGMREPVERIMTAPVISLDAGASCFEALMAMTRHHIRHVVVMAGGRAMGVLSSQELLLRQVGSPPALAARIAAAGSVEELARVGALLDPLALGLLREGAGASSLGRIVGGLREALAARACALAEAELGPPPAGYALLLMGRAARREGPALCPLWHGVVHEDAGDSGAGWFASLGRWLERGFQAMHMAGAPGSPRACDPAWRGDLGAWRARLEHWMAHGPEDPGVLDFRPVHGALWLGEALRAHVTGLAHRAGLGVLAPAPGAACGENPAEDAVNAVRAWAFGRGVTRISSVERARELCRISPLPPEFAGALEYLTAWRWVGEELRQGPMARAMERMCRKAAGRACDEMVALDGS